MIAGLGHDEAKEDVIDGRKVRKKFDKKREFSWKRLQAHRVQVSFLTVLIYSYITTSTVLLLRI